MKKRFILLFIPLLILLCIGFFFLSINFFPIRSLVSTRTWILCRFGQELHIELENKSPDSFMMLIFNGKKTELFSIEPYTHSVYTPKFRLGKKDIQVEVRFLKSNGSEETDEAYLLLSKESGLSDYTLWGDYEANLIIVPDNLGFKIIY